MSSTRRRHGYFSLCRTRLVVEVALEFFHRLPPNRAMAWRIHDNVIRGEIDNREKGHVRGKVWLDGVADPVVLELAGNAHPDLAGCLLKFSNPQPTIPMHGEHHLTPIQRGRIGDLTASRKVRVFDVPIEEALAMSKSGQKPPEHMANCLYLEWYSETNGRVVIESTDYTLEISPAEWRMEPADEEQRRNDADAGWKEFLEKLDAAVNKHQRDAKDPEEKWDEHDYERLFKESDARTDKYGELLEKYGDSDEADEKIAEEMGWSREMTEEEAEAERRNIEKINAACEAALHEPRPDPDPAREGIDWIRDERGELCHPLQHRCFESALRFRKRCEEAGASEEGDDDVARFIFEFTTTAVKLAGALQPIAEDRSFGDPAFIVAYLKRALDHLHQSQAALEAAATKRDNEGGQRLLPEALVADARRELFEIREGILRLMQELRASE